MRWFRTSRDDETAASLDVDRADGPTEVSAFAEDLRTAFPEPRVEDSIQHQHLAAMAAAARPDTAMTRPPTPRRSPVFKSLPAKITAVAVVAFASLGGLATAGALPRPVQHGVARVADTVGLNIPDPEEQDDQSGDQSGPNDQSGDQGTSGDTTGPTGSTGQSGDQSGPNDQSGDQGTSGDNNDQGSQGDQGSSGDGSDGSSTGGGDQGGQ